MQISAVSHENLQPLLYRVQAMLDALPPVVEIVEEVLPEITPETDEKQFHIYQLSDDVWYVEGLGIERAAQMTNWNYYEATMRFQRILKAMGIAEALREAGVKEGDNVRIGEAELIWGYTNAFEDE